MTYYNTNKETGETLKNSRVKAESQKDAILDVFKRLGNYPIPYSCGPSWIARQFPEWPITSIRRAITDLTKEGYLIKTESMGVGRYNKNEHQWIYNKNHGDDFTPGII